MYDFDFAAPAAAFAQWVLGTGREELFFLGWVSSRLKIVTIVRQNWCGMTVPSRFLFICSMLLLLTFPTLTVVKGRAIAGATLDTWGTEYIIALGVVGLAWILAFVHELKVRQYPF